MANWRDDVVVALAYWKNCMTIIRQYGGLLTLPTGSKIELRSDLVLANGAGNPDANLIQKVFRLH